VPWDLTGNGGTDPASVFLGTRDAQPLVIRTNDAEALRIGAKGDVGVGTPTPRSRLDVGGGTIRWADSALIPDQGGSIELMGPGTPYIDFHANGPAEDFNARIVNDADGQLTINARSTRVTGALRWGESYLGPDQGGCIELNGPGTPFIDFHFKGPAEDFNARIINDADGQLTINARSTRVTGALRWGESYLGPDQGGCIELNGPGTPFIDFHFKGPAEDYNARIINDADGRLTIDARTLRATGRLEVDAGVAFPDGSVLTTASARGAPGPAGPPGPPGPQGARGPAGPASTTSAVCVSASATSQTCSCAGRLVSRVSSPCIVTSDTGSCTASGVTLPVGRELTGACCVCAPA